MPPRRVADVYVLEILNRQKLKNWFQKQTIILLSVLMENPLK